MASKTPASQKKTATPRKRTTKTAKWVRNTRNCPVHLRLRDTNDQRYFVELQPRGLYGDVHRVPAALTDDHSLVIAINQGIVEIVTQAEVNKIDYGIIGYQGSNGVEITRPDDRTVTTGGDWDGKGKAPARHILTQDDVTRPPSSTPNYDPTDATMKQVTEDRRATQEDMIPANVDLRSRKVKVERVS